MNMNPLMSQIIQKKVAEMSPNDPKRAMLEAMARGERLDPKRVLESNPDLLKGLGDKAPEFLASLQQQQRGGEARVVSEQRPAQQDGVPVVSPQEFWRTMRDTAERAATNEKSVQKLTTEVAELRGTVQAVLAAMTENTNELRRMPSALAEVLTRPSTVGEAKE